MAVLATILLAAATLPGDTAARVGLARPVAPIGAKAVSAPVPAAAPIDAPWGSRAATPDGPGRLPPEDRSPDPAPVAAATNEATAPAAAASQAAAAPPAADLRFSAMPVNWNQPVYIPYPGRLQPAASIPSANPGYSDSLVLTFDDCGSPDQIQGVVDALAAVGRTGLFFLTGQCRDHFPSLVEGLVSRGHMVCNHTYSHPDLRTLTNAAIRWQIAAGVFAGCPYFRPPFGAWDGPRGRIAAIAAEFGLRVMLWDVDSRDWAGAPAWAMALTARRRGGVILFHLHGYATAEAVSLLG